MGPLMRRYSPYRISAFVLLVGMVPLLVSAVTQLARQDWDSLSGLAWTAFFYSLFFVVLSEEMTPLQFAGGFVIGAGIVLARATRSPAPGPD